MEKSFYLTSLFTDIKTQAWSSSDIKVAISIIKKLNSYKIYLPNLSEVDDFEKEIDLKISNIPKNMSISKFELIDILNIKSNHLARETNKIITSMHNRSIINAYDLIYDKTVKGVGGVSWFEYFRHNINGGVDLKFTETSLRILLLMIKYVRLDIKTILSLNNSYSIISYIFFKTLKDASKKTKETLTLQDFKEKMGLSGKYSEINLFRIRVLDVIIKEINQYTELNLDYELIKEGRSFSKIEFTFDYKPEYLEQKSKAKVKQLKNSKIVESKAMDEYDSPFEQILISWNIRAKKVVEVEENYSLDVIQSAIDKTLEKEKAGEIKTTKAAIFLGILENKQLASDEQFERAKNELEKQQNKHLREQISAEYDKLSSFILSNQDIIQSALTANTKHLPITDKDAIPIFKKLKSIDADKFRAYTVPILSFYHFESNSNVSSTLSDIVDRSDYIEIEEYSDDMAIVQAYKKALDKIKADEYITDEQKDILSKEVQDTINLLLGF